MPTEARPTRVKGWEPREVGPPSTELHRVVKFAAAICRSLLPFVDREIEIRWFRPGPLDNHDGGFVWGRVLPHDPGAIWLRDHDHKDLEWLVEVTCHECKHVDDGDFGDALRHRTREARCIEFQKRWGHPVYRAGSTTDWDASRVHLVDDGRPHDVWPRLEIRAGDVVLSRKTARVWEYRRGGWYELS